MRTNLKSFFRSIGMWLGVAKEKDKKYPTLDKDYVEAATKLADRKVDRRFLV